MISLSAPLWLLGLISLPLIRWLHRFTVGDRTIAVAALFLWQQANSVAATGHRPGKPDPRWRLRALLVTALLLALAGPQLERPGERTIEVWIDDSLSMQTVEQGQTRLQQVLATLEDELRQSGARHALLHSLTNPAVQRAWQAEDVQNTLGQWPADASDTAPHPPLAALLAPSRDHWLVSDGADPTLNGWAASAPLSRILQSGTEGDNAAITLLAARPSLQGDGAAQLLITVHNPGLQPQQRTLTLHAGEALLHQEPVELPPNGRREIQLQLPAAVGQPLRAALTPADALAADDALSLDTSALAPLAVSLDAGCPAALKLALRTHPRLRIAAAGALNVICDSSEPPGDGPALLIHAANPQPLTSPPLWREASGWPTLQQRWLQATTPVGAALAAKQPSSLLKPLPQRQLFGTAEQPLITLSETTPRRVDVLLDLAQPELVRQPEYLALIDGLISTTLGRPLIDESPAAVRSAAESRIAPQPLPTTAAPSTAPGDNGLGDLGPLFILLAALLLLADLLLAEPAPRSVLGKARFTRPWRWAMRGSAARLLLLTLLLLALWNPPLPWQARPLDLVVVIDASQSIDPAARAGAWRKAAASARQLPPGSRIAILRFGAQTVEELGWRDAGSDTARAILAAAAPPQRLPLDDSQTNIGAAVEETLRRCTPGRSCRIALLSDGRATTGQTTAALQLARQANIPVELITPAAQRQHDSWIATFTAPSRVGSGQQIPVTVTLASQEIGQGSIVISVDGLPAARRAVQLTPQQPVTLQFELPPSPSRATRIEAELQVEGDGEPRNNRVAQIVNSANTAPILYLSRQGALPALAQSLRAGGWEVRLASPAALPQALQQLKPGAIVLDDIAIDAMPESAWQTLIEQVTKEGTGLLVLGGEHAFGAGGYRHSRLEEILPVTAEARQPQPPAAVLFMLDTSGSMDRQDSGPSRLALARQSVLESARRLQPGDATGLLEFAATPRLVLPLAVRQNPADTLGAASESAPAGGTRLAPALREAVATLAGSTFKQKLLVLVTDGYVEEGDLTPIARQLQEAGIDLVALAIGSDADTRALLPLTRINNGRLLRVDRAMELPKLMRQELDQRRALTATGRFVPEVVEPLPFLSDIKTAWPALTSYAVTRERAAATVHLRVQGDPLLAAHHAGAGRVAVLTTALDAWQALWGQWPKAGRFAGGLMEWLDGQHGGDGLHLAARQEGDGMVLTLESAAAGSQDASVMVRDPSGQLTQLELPATAPGRHQARIAPPLPGRYHAIIRAGERQLAHEWLHGGNSEFLPGADEVPRWLRSGLLQPWSETHLTGSISADSSGRGRAPLLVATLLFLLLLLLWERRPDLLKPAVKKMQHAAHILRTRLPPIRSKR